MVGNPVPTVKSIRLAFGRESGDALSHGGHVQTDLVGIHRAVPIKSFARGGDPDATPPTQCAATKIAEAARLQQFRSSGLCHPLSVCATDCERLGDRGAGDCYPLASCRFSFVLAMEVEMSRRQTKGPPRNSPTDPRNELGQSTLGRSQDPWRTPQAWHRRWANLGRQVHGKAQEAAVPRLEDVPVQPR